MKKIILSSILLLVFCTSFLTSTVFAAENTKSADESFIIDDYSYMAKSLDSETEMQIKNDYLVNELNNDGNIDDLTVEYFKTLSDGSMLVRVNNVNDLGIDKNVQYEIGKYIYKFDNSLEEVKLYKNNRFYTIQNVYYWQIITPNIIDEIARVLCFYTQDIEDNDDYIYFSYVINGLPEALELDSATELEIKSNYAKYLYNKLGYEHTLEEISVKYFGSLNNGGMILNLNKSPFSDEIAGTHKTKIGRYVYVYSSSLYAVQVYKEGEFYWLDDAYENNIINDAELTKIAKILKLEEAANTTKIIGDVDGDNEITINDVAYLQKYIACYEYASINRRIADVDGDGVLTIYDAAQIQRSIAKISTGGTNNTGKKLI